MDPKNQKRKKFDFGIYIILLIIVIGSLFFFFNLSSEPNKLSVEDYKLSIQNGEIKDATFRSVGGDNDGLYYIKGTMTKNDKTYVYECILTLNQCEEDIYPSLILNNIKPSTAVNKSNNWLEIILSLLPLIIMVVFFVIIMRSNASGNNKAFDFAKSRARLSRDKSVTFKDVAGCDEEKQELEEIIDFLKNPRKYIEIGARVPKGVLLVGPPGTGKTLLAKAVAGEANVPFFSISGSDFVEMFVGVGASRVRDLFKTAKENLPCIIFIDEIDAVGRQRGTGLGGGHDEREQTLNQLLVEIDGFGNNSGVIIMAATNRPDVLDPALLRPGRFDRQITINTPDVIGREAVLKVHARNKQFSPNVKFDEVAQRIPGFSGADIENLLNEAALLAARANRKVIEIADIDEAMDRVMMGPAKKTRKITAKERIMIAHHEAGHAVIGIKLENANIVQKVTIVPRGRAGGYALMLPEDETMLETKQSLLDKITGYLGGRVSEESNVGEITTGAHNDFQQATKIARAMVAEYGMSELGPVQYDMGNENVFLGRDYMHERQFSDHVAMEIDKAVRDIINECYERATKCIKENLDLLKTIANYLLEIETLTKSDIYEIVETGKLGWWEEKKAKKALEKESDSSLNIDSKESNESKDSNEEVGH